MNLDLTILWKNIGWITTMFLGAVSWFVYFVRMNDKVNNMSEQLKQAIADIAEMRVEMQEQNFKVNSQQNHISELKTSTDELNKAIQQLNINTEVIAAWIKQQSGDTLISHKKGR